MAIYPRTNYEMTKEDLESILDACKSTPVIMIGSYVPSSPQENANRAWRILGKKIGFDSTTVQPIQGKGQKFFSAIPSETEEHKKDRLVREVEEKRLNEIESIKVEIARKQKRLDYLIRGE